MFCLFLAVCLCSGVVYIGTVIWLLTTIRGKRICRPGSVDIKERKNQQIAFMLMEHQYPLDLESYCNYYNLSFFKLQLKCIFCKCILTPVDLALFFVKKLSIIWRSNESFACCNSCLHLSARYESERYFQCSCKVEILHELIEKPLHDVVMRCYYCLTLLDIGEKCDLVARNKEAVLIRGHWRAPCRECINKD